MKADKTAGLGERIRTHRVAVGLTLEQTGRLVGADPNTVGRAERGEQEPSLRILRRYAEVFGVAIDDLASTRQTGVKEDLRRQFQALEGLIWIGTYMSEKLSAIAQSSENHLVRAFFQAASDEAKRSESARSAVLHEFEERWKDIDPATHPARQDGRKDFEAEAKQNDKTARWTKERDEKLAACEPKPFAAIAEAVAIFSPVQIELVKAIAGGSKYRQKEATEHRLRCLIETLSDQ